MDKKQVEMLKALTKNPAANAVLHKLALRQRSRKSLAVNALKDAMEKEGFNYDRDSYRGVIKGLADAGMGDLVVSRRGTIKEIKNLRFNLKDIGLAACSSNSDRSSETRQPRRAKIIALPAPVKKQLQATKIEKPYLAEIVNIGVKLKGKLVTIGINDKLDASELNELIARLVK